MYLSRLDLQNCHLKGDVPARQRVVKVNRNFFIVKVNYDTRQLGILGIGK
jgi:hypothetical protein